MTIKLNDSTTFDVVRVNRSYTKNAGSVQLFIAIPRRKNSLENVVETFTDENCKKMILDMDGLEEVEFKDYSVNVINEDLVGNVISITFVIK